MFRCDHSYGRLIAGCLIRGSGCSIGLLIFECIGSFGTRIASVVGSLGESLVSRWEDWHGRTSLLLKGVLSEERLVGEGFSSSCLLDGIVAASAVWAIGEMWFSAHSASEMCANPILRFDLLHRFASLDAIVARLVVFGFEMFPASAQSAYWRAGLLACKTAFDSAIFVLHTRLVLASKLPAEVALLEVDSFFPMVWGNQGREHDDL